MLKWYSDFVLTTWAKLKKEDKGMDKDWYHNANRKFHCVHMIVHNEPVSIMLFKVQILGSTACSRFPYLILLHFTADDVYTSLQSTLK